MPHFARSHLLLGLIISALFSSGGTSSSAQPTTSTTPALCRPPAISQFRRHKLQPSDSLASLAQAYNLRPETLQGANPSLRGGAVPVGREIFIPPFDGVLINLAPGVSLTDLGKTYGIRPDVLFEMNGCQPRPRQVFVPGVRWSPQGILRSPAPYVTARTNIQFRYPLATLATVLTSYGWQVTGTGKNEFHPGIDLATTARTRVFAVAAGTVAFAGERPDSGGLVVLNHASGLQTRYAQLDQITVSMGEQVAAGAFLGTVALSTSAKPSHLHFEVRLNSANGWVAQDPNLYLPTAP